MRQALVLHRDFRCDAVARIDVDVARPRPGALELAYSVFGHIEAVYLPPIAASQRADELWRRTCFEAFVRPSGGAGYLEFNFSPSTHWAGYQFDAYREGMSAPEAAVAPQITVSASDERLDLRVALDLTRLLGPATSAEWRLGLSAVIEETNGSKSYWALTHPPGKADFHHADGFALVLQP